MIVKRKGVSLMKQKYLQKTFIYCSFIFVISLLITVVKYNILPPKYFYDSNKIVNIMNGIGLTDSGFTYAANFYRSIDIFQIKELHLFINGQTVIIDEMLQWGLILSFLGTTFLFNLLIKRKEYSFMEYIFIYISVVLLNIYVFNISKDFIQFLFLLVLYIILMNKKWNNKVKILLMSLVLSYEALNFRMYYGIMALLIISLYSIYQLLFKDKELTTSNLVRFLLISFLAFFIEVFGVSLISNSSFQEIMTARSSVNDIREGSMDAATIILEPLGDNTNIFIFSVNYIINFIRMLLPFELMLKGIKYLAFIIYQLFITYNIYLLWKKTKNNPKTILLFITILSYEMMSVIFEPDFGSFVKHQTAMTLIFLEMIITNNLKFNVFELIERFKLVREVF